jgi:tetratricopeptide (TPR) repeat protein
MRATLKCLFRFVVQASACKASHTPKGRLILITLAVFATTLSRASDFLAEAEFAYHAAQSAYSTNQTLDTAIAAARTAFDYADLAPNDQIRENIANQGIAIARSAIALKTNSAAAHYYMALNIGQVARTKMLGALKLLTDMERELKTVIALDPKFDYAGGHRTIGVLYLEAPGFSVGDKTKARQNLEQALRLAPEYPDNHLCYLEALIKWHDWKNAATRLADYQAILPTAKTNFTGPDWENEWHDWTKRQSSIQSKLKSH